MFNNVAHAKRAIGPHITTIAAKAYPGLPPSTNAFTMSTRACHLFTGQTPSKKKYISLAGSGLLALRAVGPQSGVMVKRVLWVSK